MNKIAIGDLKEGMIFSAPVFIHGNSQLVAAGIPLQQKDISRLQSWGIDTVETEGKLLKNSDGDENSDDDSPAASLFDSLENDEVYHKYVDLIQRLDVICRSIIMGVPTEPRFIDSIVGQLLIAVREQRSLYISYILGGNIKDHSLAKSLVNTAILSASMAVEMKLPHHKVLHIVTGALLHDIGMLKVPQGIVEKKGSLSPLELQKIQLHPLYAYKIVSQELMYPPEVGEIVIQHHERWDGEGYPRHISGEMINMGARIVSVADAFEAMVSKKSYRNSIVGYDALKNLLSDNMRRFDPEVIKMFIQTMGIYPIGSIVLLNNGAMARVISTQGLAPLRPMVSILVDEHGRVFKPDEGAKINLLNEKNLFISKAVDEKEAAAKYV